jgi:tetratricopeptide (TPR) repeat protein
MRGDIRAHMSRRKPKRNSIKNSAAPLSGRKLWGFRLAALAGVPLLCLGLLELGLRLAGFGYPTVFLLKSSNHGENTYVQNNQFGWRFFGPRAARQPEATSILREKPPGTVRIFVFGESAAYGDPQPRFGLPRLLQALLGGRHPGNKFEVVNAAMTGINSHVIRPLARDCAEARADVWVIYMGNNEVVGPFGAGTVFGGQTTPLPLIRAGLALKATRTGQWLDTLRRAAQKTAAENGEWGGMGMFVNNKVGGADPRLGAVYANFGQNLQAIIAAGRKSGANIVLSTVGVNLKDCAPFASLHRPDLSEAGLKEWQRWFAAGTNAQAGGDFRRAATAYEQAEQMDDGFAELRFRRGQCALALQEAGAAQTEFAAARDLDALRFRCDRRLNEIIRRQAAEGVALADGERALAEASPTGLPGAELFYEHVHLNFEGNYVLARAVAEKVEEVLRLAASAPWPDLDQCAQRLGHTPRDTQLARSEILGRLADAPFTLQADHDEQMRRLTAAAAEMPPPDSAAALRGAQSTAEAALAQWPDDGGLWEQLGEIKAREGDNAGAVAAVEHAFDLVPSQGPECWLLYGTLLGQEEKYEEAIAAFKHVNEFFSRADWAGYNLAFCLEKLGRRDEAIVEFKRILARKPDFGKGWLGLGQLYEEMGRTNDAEQCYHTALTHHLNQADDLATLARFCASRRWFGAAATNFADAIQLSPSDPGLRLEAGRVLAALDRHEEAARQYQSAVERAPDQVQPHLQLGVELGRLGKPVLAEREFRQVLRLNPDLLAARANLGVALYEQNRLEEARQEFEVVLQRNPENETALRYAQRLRERTSWPAAR